MLDGRLRLKAAPRLRFAGQIAGVEGYVESAAIGLVAGRFAAGRGAPPPPETALGALLGHITGGGDAATFQPMNVNSGCFRPSPGESASASAKRAYSSRALVAVDARLAGAATLDAPGESSASAHHTGV